MEEDLYEKSNKEFWDIIQQEKKAIDKKKGADMDKSDQGKVCFTQSLVLYKSLCVRKPTNRVPTRSYTNWPVQSQKRARSLKFRI